MILYYVFLNISDNIVFKTYLFLRYYFTVNILLTTFIRNACLFLSDVCRLMTTFSCLSSLCICTSRSPLLTPLFSLWYPLLLCQPLLIKTNQRYSNVSACTFGLFIARWASPHNAVMQELQENSSNDLQNEKTLNTLIYI